VLVSPGIFIACGKTVPDKAARNMLVAPRNADFLQNRYNVGILILIAALRSHALPYAKS
jgi:hypothetical protein